jgi:hypothetical protein
MKIAVSRMILFVLLLLLLQPLAVVSASFYGAVVHQTQGRVTAVQSTAPAAAAAARRGALESSALLQAQSLTSNSWGRHVGGPKGSASSSSLRSKTWSLSDAGSSRSFDTTTTTPMMMMMTQRSRGGATASSKGATARSSSSSSGAMMTRMQQLSERSSLSGSNSLPRMMSMARNKSGGKSTRGGRLSNQDGPLAMMSTPEVLSLVHDVLEHSPEIVAQQVTSAVRTVVANGPEILGWAFAAVCFLQTKTETSSSSSSSTSSTAATTLAEAPAPLPPLGPLWAASSSTVPQNAAPPPRRGDGTFGLLYEWDSVLAGGIVDSYNSPCCRCFFAQRHPHRG